MKSIDELLGEVAQKLNTEPPKNNNQSPPRTTVETTPQIKSIVHNTYNSSDIKMFDSLTLSLAKELAYVVEKAAEGMNLNVAISVYNNGANPILLNVMDDALIVSSSAAAQKAYTAVVLKMPTHTALKESRGGAFDGLTNGNGILMLGGGYPLEAKGQLLGGIGVSGGTKEQDATLAKLASDYFKMRIR